MSCVPYEQTGFAYGPRDYLNQMMSLISTLRGGQQRYMPLLLAKISESMPSLTIPAYALPAPLSRGSSYEDGFEDHTQAPSSGPDSGVTSPYGSPLSAPAGFGFQDLNLTPATSVGGYVGPMTTSMQYSDLTVSAPGPLHMYQDPAMHGYPGGQVHVKYEGTG